MLRGCGDEKKTEDECETNSEVLEDVILNDKDNETNSEDYDMMSDVSGGQCTCTEELCNTHTIEEVIPGQFVQGSHGHGKSWKTMEKIQNPGLGKSWKMKIRQKVMEKSWNLEVL